MIIIEKIKKSILITILILILGLTPICYAEEVQVEPATVNDEISENGYSSTVSNTYLVLSQNEIIANTLNKYIDITTSVGASSSSSSYDLRDNYDIEVKNQGNTEMCWAFSILSATEINLLVTSNTTVDLSEEHMNYATSTSFYDGTNEYAFNRTAADGGAFNIGLAYLTNGQGAVLEEEMSFTETTSDISLSSIDINPSYYVTEYEILPTIYKINSNGTTLYTDGYGTYYSDSEVDSLREIIKQYILDYGSVTAYTAAGALNYYNNSNVFEATAYYLDDMEIADVDHAVTIIGWDDNYSKDNFTGAATPSKDGAYIVLNSYSSDSFDNGIIYISYEDVWIETSLYGISEVSTVDYENLYQHDEFGATAPITLTADGSSTSELYYASVYSRESTDNEMLYEVSVSTNQYAKFEVYVNTSGSDTSLSSLTKVATTSVLNPGYNTISFDGVQLTGSTFAVVIKQIAIDETCYFMVEAPLSGTFYENITATAGDSKVSLDGTTWYDLSALGTTTYSGYTIDLSKSDVCIKAFTKIGNSSNDDDDESNETNSITSNTYLISSSNYITKIYDNTTINTFLSNVTITGNYSFIKDNTTVTDYTSLITTNMRLKVGDTTYYLAVRGDLNGDGKITLTDLSKEILHYVKYSDSYILSGAYEKAADINFDGNVTLTDLSQLKVIYVNM